MEGYTRPYWDKDGNLIYLTDEEALKRSDILRLQAGEAVPPEKVPTDQIGLSTEGAAPMLPAPPPRSG